METAQAECANASKSVSARGLKARKLSDRQESQLHPHTNKNQAKGNRRKNNVDSPVLVEDQCFAMEMDAKTREVRSLTRS
ncbi:hypothetical protein NQZ68_008119 [Dissostichus eleginoides]|nr:hypothetical protein NQZ68_008119 [Dissostichus eleginoides]